jgi:hypothetical protein
VVVVGGSGKEEEINVYRLSIHPIQRTTRGDWYDCVCAYVCALALIMTFISKMETKLLTKCYQFRV